VKRRSDITRRSGLGLLLLAIGRKRGFGYFGTDTDAYLASLAPLVAFALVVGALLALQSWRDGATLFLLWICQLLAPAIISHPLCQRWDRMDRWALYANILNWAPFLFFMVLAAVMAVARTAVEAGAPADATVKAAVVAFLAYVVWFQWFVARGALVLSRKRTLVLLAATFLFGVLLVSIQLAFGPGPQALTQALKA
jgi:hypothetical protein